MTPENWENFIDENRMITYYGDELIFEGNFTADLGIGNIQIVMPITLTGTNAVMTNVSFYVLSDEVVIDGFTLIEDRNDISPIFVMDAEDVEISNVKMNFTAIDGYIGGYAIWINDAVNIRLLNNEINYVGTTVYNVSGTDKRFAVLIEDSSKVLLQGNKFDIQTTSCAVDWVEEPAGSWNYVRYPNVSGIRITDTDEVTFENNEVNIKFIDVSGSADTIYVLDLDGCDDAIITNNTINSLGYGYIYNIIITGDDFEISSNNITATGNNYACGIDIEGPASGVVENNTIVCNANSSAYAIYSGMNYKEVRANYTGNNISGKAYCFFGFSIGDVESNIKGNQLFMDGNYTTGIAYKGSKVNIEENRIVLLASEEGNEFIWDDFGVEAVGIKVVQGEALIKNNTIATSGKGISLTGSRTSASVEDNFINVAGNANKDAYAIYANGVDALSISGNDVDYQGNTEGAGINNAVYINNTAGALISGNKFYMEVVSCYVNWVEEPAGSWNYVSYPISEGIVVENSDAATFDSNNVTVIVTSVCGTDDTFYSVDFKNSNNPVITNNKINSTGFSYIYGIILAGEDFIIRSNEITSTGDNYACGIDIEGPASGVVEDNVIVCNANSSAYAIYSGMNGKEVRANYTGNNISGKAYCFFGFSIGDVESNIKGNQLFMDGNYTTGIAYKGSKVNIEENRIVLLASEEGNEYIWDSFGVEAVGIKVVQGEALIKNNTIATSGKGISLTRSLTSASVEDNFINVVGNDDKDAYAIYASDVAGLNVFGNYIDYQGTTKGTGINNAVYLKNTTEAVISENKFEIELVSINVPWAEVPSGSGNWVPSPVSEGIVFEDSDGVVFESNNVTVNYGEVLSGGYDSIYGIDLKNSSYAAIAYNNIETTGNTYVYGITTSSDNYLIIGNNITTIANYYAEGIEVKSSGIIADNVISSIAPDIAYGIGPGMASDKFNVEVSENDISGNAYYACGINFANGNISVEDNNIILNGNYTVGINSGADNLNAEGNVIIANASNEGSTSYSGIVTETLGISVNSGVATICENTIESTSNTAVDLGDTPSTVEDNKVIANGTSGNDAISASGNATIKGNGVLITKLSGIDLSGVYGDVLVYKLSLTYENGTAIANQHILISVGENNITIITDGNGYATMKIDTASLNLGKGDNIIKASYAGDGSDVGSTTTNIISITPKATKLDYKKSVTVLITAVKKGSAYYKITLKDADGKAIAGKQIKVVFNGATKTVTTDKNGVANFKLSAKKVGNYKITMNFAGDDKYAASTATATIKVSKEATKLTAKKKTFKAKVKTKKYTVTVKDSKGKAIKGLKLTLKVKGKTIKATTNAKGKATFKIKNLKKKGKFTAKVKFAGNNLYKSAVKSVKITVKK